MDTADIILREELDDDEKESLPQQEIETLQQVPTKVLAPSSPLSVLKQRELERITRISEAPRSRSERAQASRATTLNDEDQPAYESVLLAIVKSSSYKRAIKGDEKLNWELAIKSEYDSLVSNKTWDLVRYDHTMKVIGSSWKFKLKRDKEGNITKYKARRVAGGDQQEPD